MAVRLPGLTARAERLSVTDGNAWMCLPVSRHPHQYTTPKTLTNIKKAPVNTRLPRPSINEVKRSRLVVIQGPYAGATAAAPSAAILGGVPAAEACEDRTDGVRGGVVWYRSLIIIIHALLVADIVAADAGDQ